MWGTKSFPSSPISNFKVSYKQRKHKKRDVNQNEDGISQIQYQIKVTARAVPVPAMDTIDCTAELRGKSPLAVSILSKL